MGVLLGLLLLLQSLWSSLFLVLTSFCFPFYMAVYICPILGGSGFLGVTSHSSFHLHTTLHSEH